ncbi:hypothetical protein LCGC14_1377010 [marine sediment metagenome]|uniref:Uncharacterized protein n=1 Tax=marine sediment metagenome TaxID=412755 RepID=A0A0F9K3S4_9ZZZZ
MANVSDVVSTSTVELALRHYFVRGTVSIVPDVEFTAHLDHAANLMVLTLTAGVAGERVSEVRYPRDWWQAVREKFLPKWWLQRFPVQYHTWKADAHYPQLKLERGSFNPVLHVYSSERSQGYPHYEDEPVREDD